MQWESRIQGPWVASLIRAPIHREVAMRKANFFHCSNFCIFGSVCYSSWPVFYYAFHLIIMQYKEYISIVFIEILKCL